MGIYQTVPWLDCKTEDSMSYLTSYMESQLQQTLQSSSFGPLKGSYNVM